MLFGCIGLLFINYVILGIGCLIIFILRIILVFLFIFKLLGIFIKLGRMGLFVFGSVSWIGLYFKVEIVFGIKGIFFGLGKISYKNELIEI